MEYARLGNSGLRVSRISLGCMSFGDPSRGFNEWSLGEEDAGPFFKQAVELGITFWDTANVYQLGSSEEIVGRAIKKYSRREDIVLATKVHFPMHEGPGGSGLSRKAILEQIDASLTRLGTDYVDLYQIHRFDPNTPIEETMEALHDVVKAGKARYLGASSMWAWQFAKMQHVAELHGWTKFVSMQDLYNLMQREEEREMFGLHSTGTHRLDTSIGVTNRAGRLTTTPPMTYATERGAELRAAGPCPPTSPMTAWRTGSCPERSGQRAVDAMYANAPWPDAHIATCLGLRSPHVGTTSVRATPRARRRALGGCEPRRTSTNLFAPSAADRLSSPNCAHQSVHAT